MLRDRGRVAAAVCGGRNIFGAKSAASDSGSYNLSVRLLLGKLPEEDADVYLIA
jgi:hypothetical protein